MPVEQVWILGSINRIGGPGDGKFGPDWEVW